ncbi:MAG: threonine/serine exporter family protein [Opitutales bacterium]|jgi:uncharacterized membrane protein YjjP (DUF1212 family)
MSDLPADSLSRRQLDGVARALLRVAGMLMENGAETRRVFETVREMGRSLGVGELHVLVTHRSVIVTVASGDEAVTRIIRVGTLGVDHSRVSAISLVFQRLQQGGFSLARVDELLGRIASAPAQYPRWLVLLMVGLACGAFSRISGGDWAAFVACSLAATFGFWVRRELAGQHFQPLLCVFCAAFVSASLATLMARSLGSHALGAGVAASVLYLVPGVPMINAVADLVKGHLLTGFSRALTVALTAVSVSMGLIMAMRVVGLGNF